jgi:hypothetical protein
LVMLEPRMAAMATAIQVTLQKLYILEYWGKVTSLVIVSICLGNAPIGGEKQHKLIKLPQTYMHMQLRRACMLDRRADPLNQPMRLLGPPQKL